MNARVIAATAAALLTVSTAAYAMFGQALLITRGKPPAVPIGITFSPSAPNISDTSGSGITISTIAVTMSSGSFSGLLSLPNNGDGIAALSGSNLVTARTLTAGDDGNHSPQVCASQNSVQVCQTITITVTGSGSVPVPTAAAAANLTTLARNWDWSQPQYANQSSWLDCNDADASKEWHKGSPGEFAAQLPCDINQGLDDQGNTVLVYNFTTAYSNTSNCQSSGNGQCFQSMQTANFSPAQQMAFPNGSYMEIDVKESNSLYNNGNNNGSGPDGMYVVTNDPTDNNAMLLRPQWIEHDPGELWTSASGFANGNLMVYPEQSPGGVWFSFNSQNNLPSGWSVTTYHKYAVMSTVNASGTSMYSCLFVDDILQQRCFAMDLNANPRMPFYPQRIIVWSGGGGVAVNKKMYVKTIRVWSCSNWQGQMTDHGNVYCGGNTLFDNGSLRYWH